jgi:hypothetical protein
MDPTEELLRKLAHRLWESRGCKLGEPERDWYEAQSLVGAIEDARSKSPPAFYHCFSRGADERRSLATLRLILDVGILLTPEHLQPHGLPGVTQCRLSLAFIQAHELCAHAKKFGPFALEMAPFEDMVGRFGASPVWYIQSFIKEDGGEDLFRHGADLLKGLHHLQDWIHSKQSDPTRHEPHRVSRLYMRLLYPTHYRDSTNIEDIYYLQREWRVVRRDTALDELTALTDEEKRKLLAHDKRFFEGAVPVWSEETGRMVNVRRVDATSKMRASFRELVRSILVPRDMVAEVRALSPGVPVLDMERFEFGFPRSQRLPLAWSP